jgi:hypothetical protein
MAFKKSNAMDGSIITTFVLQFCRLCNYWPINCENDYELDVYFIKGIKPYHFIMVDIALTLEGHYHPSTWNTWSSKDTSFTIGLFETQTTLLLESLLKDFFAIIVNFFNKLWV